MTWLYLAIAVIVVLGAAFAVTKLHGKTLVDDTEKLIEFVDEELISNGIIKENDKFDQIADGICIALSEISASADPTLTPSQKVDAAMVNIQAEASKLGITYSEDQLAVMRVVLLAGFALIVVFGTDYVQVSKVVKLRRLLAARRV